jgi:hypothetical protein
MIRRYELVRPLRSEYLRADRLDESAWEPVSKATFSALWEEEYAADESQLVTETVYLATGLLLPIWGALPKEDLTVNRIVDKSGASWLGRHVHDLYVDATLEKLGVARKAQTDPAKIAAAILGGGTWKAPHPLNFTIRTSRGERFPKDRDRRCRSRAHSRAQGQGLLHRDHRLQDAGVRAAGRGAMKFLLDTHVLLMGGGLSGTAYTLCHPQAYRR